MTDLASMVIEGRWAEYWGRTDCGLHHGRNTTPTQHEVASFCCVMVTCRNDLGGKPIQAGSMIYLCCVLGMDWMNGNTGKFVIKCI